MKTFAILSLALLSFPCGSVLIEQTRSGSLALRGGPLEREIGSKGGKARATALPGTLGAFQEAK